jgi:hypothetical protein
MKEPQKLARTKSSATDRPAAISAPAFESPGKTSGAGHRLADLSVLPPLQAKLEVGAANDHYEQEADSVAAQVVQRVASDEEEELQMKPADTVQRVASDEEEELQMKPAITSIQRVASDEEEELQMKPDSTVQRAGIEDEELQMKPGADNGANGFTAPTHVEQSIASKRGGGAALPDTTRSQMESGFGVDFSGVRIHADDKSHQLNQAIGARAFTTGQDVFFSQGQFKPDSRSGQELLAHELTHVVQQGGAQRKR